MKGPVPRSVEERFWQYVSPEPMSGCWLWTGGLNSAGYGQISLRGAGMECAHRVSYRIHKGPVPMYLEINHRCMVRSCVNPDHLEAVTHRENMRYGNGPAACRARQTHCKYGHLFDDKNTYQTNQRTRV